MKDDRAIPLSLHRCSPVNSHTLQPAKTCKISFLDVANLNRSPSPKGSFLAFPSAKHRMCSREKACVWTRLKFFHASFADESSKLLLTSKFAAVGYIYIISSPAHKKRVMISWATATEGSFCEALNPVRSYDNGEYVPRDLNEGDFVVLKGLRTYDFSRGAIINLMKVTLEVCIEWELLLTIESYVVYSNRSA